MSDLDGQELTEAERRHLRVLLKRLGPELCVGRDRNCVICREVNLYLSENADDDA